MPPAQHLVTWNVFGSQPSGQSVSAAFEAMDSIVARRRGLRSPILSRDVEKSRCGDVLEE